MHYSFLHGRLGPQGSHLVLRIWEPVVIPLFSEVLYSHQVSPVPLAVEGLEHLEKELQLKLGTRITL